MNPDIFAEVVEASIAAYADDKVAAGHWPRAGALERSRNDFLSLLPQGLATPDHRWFEIRAGEDGPRVGHLWFAVQEQHGQCGAFVYGVEVQPAHRRQGHARRAFEALELLAAELGAARIGLHVFGFNAAAQALYRSLGYAVTSLNMSKPLQPAGASE
jgi:ribosomal protein S18 acetylase RimI-like enzyme